MDGRSFFLASAAYLVAGILFILSLRGLSSQQTARRGNLYGIIGMAVAILATLSLTDHLPHPLLLAAIVGGAAIGSVMAIRVGMTQMPDASGTFGADHLMGGADHDSGGERSSPSQVWRRGMVPPSATALLVSENSATANLPWSRVAFP